jgi:hypothetical protein
LARALAPAALVLSGLGPSVTHPRVANLVRGYELGDTLMATRRILRELVSQERLIGYSRL